MPGVRVAVRESASGRDRQEHPLFPRAQSGGRRRDFRRRGGGDEGVQRHGHESGVCVGGRGYHVARGRRAGEILLQV